MSTAPPGHRMRRPDGSAVGQALAMIVILLLCLPLLPLILAVVAVVRLRDRFAARHEARAAEAHAIEAGAAEASATARPFPGMPAFPTDHGHKHVA